MTNSPVRCKRIRCPSRSVGRPEEFAADIFMGRFSPKFLRATHPAGELLVGSLYARYYNLDYSALPQPDQDGKLGSSTAAFDALCHARAGTSPAQSSVAANGMVIEQAQILTTHLATLVHAVGFSSARRWAQQARPTFTTVLRLAERIERNPVRFR